MQTCSIVIPVYNEEQSVLSQLNYWHSLEQKGFELIFVDGGSGDNTRHILDRHFSRVYQCAAGRARQMNMGAQHSTRAIILFLHCDTRLPETSVEITEVAWRWGFFYIQLSGQLNILRWIERGINWRSRMFKVATGDQALFFKREFFEELGGFADIPLMEDIDVSRRARKSAQPTIQKNRVLSSSRRWEKNGAIKTVLLMWWIQLQYRCGVDPAKLVIQYYGVNNNTKARPNHD